MHTSLLPVVIVQEKRKKLCIVGRLIIRIVLWNVSVRVDEKKRVLLASWIGTKEIIMEVSQMMDILTFLLVICATGALAEWFFSRED